MEDVLNHKTKQRQARFTRKGGKRLQRKPQMGGVQWDRGTRTQRVLYNNTENGIQTEQLLAVHRGEQLGLGHDSGPGDHFAGTADSWCQQ
jgi:hypothetical protein